MIFRKAPRLMHLPFRWCLLVLAGTALALMAPAAVAAQQASEPESPQKASLTYKNWTFTLHAGDGGTSPVEIAVRHRQGGLETVLRPDRDLDCPDIGGILAGCRSVVDSPRRDSLRGKGMIVHAAVPDDFHPPEVIAVLDTGGASGSFSAVGYWRGQAGPWQHRTLNSGSTAIVADANGRIRIGDPLWESLDWPRAARYPYRSWYTLAPYGRNAGFKPASRRSDHRRELRAATVTLRRLNRSGGRSAREGRRSVRAVIAAHRKALGHTRQLAQARRSYRRSYGAASLRRLDRGLRRVVRVTS